MVAQVLLARCTYLELIYLISIEFQRFCVCVGRRSE